MRAWEPFLRVDGWKSDYDSVDRALKHYGRKTRSEHTRQSFCDTLMRFLKFVDMNPDEVVELSPDDASRLVQEYIDHLADRGLSIRTVNVTLAYLKVFFRVNDFKGDRELEVERYHQPTRYRKRPEYIPTPEEIYRMAYSAGSTRNRTIVLSLYTSGLRNSTLRGLRIGDVIDELENGLKAIRVPVYPEMKELVEDACKGSIPYYSFLSRESTEALREYLNERKKTYGEVSLDEPLFCANSPNYDPYLSRKTPVKKRTLTEVVKRAARKAGIKQWKHVSPHCLRKAFESSLRNNRLDTKDQEFLMGHILPGSQDAYYDRSKIETLRKKYARIVFFPERAFSDEALRRRQLLDTAKMLGYEDDKLMKLQEILARAKTVDEAVDEFRKLKTEAIEVSPNAKLRRFGEGLNNTHRIVDSEEEMLKLLDEGWKLVRELNGGRFLMSLL